MVQSFPSQERYGVCNWAYRMHGMHNEQRCVLFYANEYCWGKWCMAQCEPGMRGWGGGSSVLWGCSSLSAGCISARRPLIAQPTPYTQPNVLDGGPASQMVSQNWDEIWCVLSGRYILCMCNKQKTCPCWHDILYTSTGIMMVQRHRRSTSIYMGLSD